MVSYPVAKVAAAARFLKRCRESPPPSRRASSNPRKHCRTEILTGSSGPVCHPNSAGQFERDPWLRRSAHKYAQSGDGRCVGG